MPFDDFLGNRSVLETVRTQLATGRLRHSMLFAGVTGIGKWTLAQFIAKASNCIRLQNDFCDSCPSCERISDNAHPDVRNVAPDGQFIKIDQMRSLSREVFFKPFEGRRRVFIIDEAEKFRDESANSILKTLEEPPDTSFLILITSRPNDLLPTIRSRCQTYRFAPLSAERHRAAVARTHVLFCRRTTAACTNRRRQSWQSPHRRSGRIPEAARRNDGRAGGLL